MNDKIILIGGGGHCKSCIDVIEQEGKYQIAGIVDMPEKRGQLVLGYPVLGCDDDLPALIKTYPNVLITLGQVKAPTRRIELFNDLLNMGARFPLIQSPLAYVSPHALVAEGTIVMHHALINAGAQVGRNSIIYTKAIVEHDAVIEDHCHISTGVIVNGGVTIQEGSFLSSNSMCRENIQIGSRSIVGGWGSSFKEYDVGDTKHKKLKIGILGASGFSRETADICIALGYGKIIFLDVGVTTDSCFGFPLVEESQITRLHEEGYHFVIGIGDNETRKNIYNKFQYLKYKNMVHPSVSMGHGQLQYLAETTGNIIAAGVRFTNAIKLGNFGIYNLNCTIGHDCIINDYINIAPGANVSGNVLLKEGAYIGTNATILQGSSIDNKMVIGMFSTVGAGSVVTKPVNDYDVVVGVPAKPLIKTRNL